MATGLINSSDNLVKQLGDEGSKEFAQFNPIRDLVCDNGHWSSFIATVCSVNNAQANSSL